MLTTHSEGSARCPGWPGAALRDPSRKLLRTAFCKISKSFVHISRAVTHCSMFMHISRGVTDDTCHKWTCAVFMWRFNQVIPLWTLHSDPYCSMFMHISSHFMLCLFIQCSSAQGAYWTYLQLYLFPTSFLQRSLHRYRTLCRIILLLSILIVLQCTLNCATTLYLFDWT